MFFSHNILSVYCSTGEIDKIAIVAWVQDGDTFRTEDDEWIRLADINCSEKNQPGYLEATNYMISTVKNKTVFLDIDDKYTYDEKDGEKGKGDRLVCVVYVDHNETHYLNVNKALLVEGHAEITNYDNEFNPYSWSLYVSKENIPEFTSGTILLLFFLVATLLVTVWLKYEKKKSCSSSWYIGNYFSTFWAMNMS